MEIKWIEDFIALAQYQSFSRAAEFRNVTQSGFSRRIQSLEQWVGAELIDRSSFPPVLTPAGRLFREVAEDTLEKLFDTRAIIRTKQRIAGKSLQIAAGHTIALNFLPSWLKALAARFGEVRARVVPTNVHDSILMLVNGNCELMFAYHHPELPLHLDPVRYEHVTVGIDTLMPVSRPNQRLAPSFRLPGTPKEPLPHISYTETSYFGRFLDKIVRNTPARRDQDHVKLLVEQNPQIPDRTENLIGEGADPTVSLYATCKRLEEGGADIIAIPCNTAHAFVERIQPYLRVPIVNMLTETVRYVHEHYPAQRKIGVLATSGTLASGVYEKALEAQGFQQIAPEPALQSRVMQAIYGKQGVKAGFTVGACQDDIAAAVEGLIDEGVEVIVLGCTELPLLLPHDEFVGSGGARVTLIDPTDVLARRCIAYALAAREKR